MPDFDGLQPFLFAHITAIRPFLFLVTARIRAVYVPFYVFRERIRLCTRRRDPVYTYRLF